MDADIEDFHLHILGCMFNAGVIGGKYWPIQYIERKCRWAKLAKEHGIRKGLKKVLRYLESLGLVNLHGKSRNPVVSLTSEGVAVARAYLDI